MKTTKSTGKPFDVGGVTGQLLINNETGEITGCYFDHLSTVWNPTGNISAYMKLGGNGRHLTVSDLFKEYCNAYPARGARGLSLWEYVTAIVIPRERASAVHAFEQEQYEQEHGKPWGFSAAKWVGGK